MNNTNHLSREKFVLVTAPTKGAVARKLLIWSDLNGGNVLENRRESELDHATRDDARRLRAGEGIRSVRGPGRAQEKGA